jgi:hypothetical protein
VKIGRLTAGASFSPSDPLEDGADTLQKLLDDIQLRLDDARSGNVFFLSIAVMKISEAHVDLKSKLSLLRVARGRLAADPKNEESQKAVATAENRVKKQNEEIAKLSIHRYIDDIESALYAHLFQVRDPETSALT